MFFEIKAHPDLQIKYLHQDRVPDMLQSLMVNLNQCGFISIEKDRIDFVLPVQLVRVSVEFKTMHAAAIITDKLMIELAKISNPPYRIGGCCGG